MGARLVNIGAWSEQSADFKAFISQQSFFVEMANLPAEIF